MGFKSVLFLLGLGNQAATVQTPVNAQPIHSSWGQAGIAVMYGDSLFQSNRVETIGILNGQIDSYTHEVRRIGGYWSASINIKVNIQEMRDWLENGLCRHIKVVNQSQQTVWEGFVDSVSSGLGAVTVQVGPLITRDFANKVKMRYSVADYTLSPPSVGVTLTTAPAENTVSQRKYGIFERILTGSDMNQTLATTLRDSWLKEHSFPKVTINTSSGQNILEPVVTINCLGYWHYLDAWTYTNSTTGVINASEKIKDIFASDPNEIFSTNYGQVEENTTQVPAQETEDRTPTPILQDIVSLGDNLRNIYMLGVFEGRKVKYRPIESKISYIQDIDGLVKSRFHQPVYPWDIRPGEWIFVTGIFPSESIPESETEIEQSLSSGIVESITFNAPNQISISTARLNKLDQLLARLGIGSI